MDPITPFIAAAVLLAASMLAYFYYTRKTFAIERRSERESEERLGRTAQSLQASAEALAALRGALVARADTRQTEAKLNEAIAELAVWRERGTARQKAIAR